MKGVPETQKPLLRQEAPPLSDAKEPSMLQPLVLCTYLATTVMCLLVAIIAPFYSQHVRALYNASHLQISAVFAAYPLSVALCSPLLSILCRRHRPVQILGGSLCCLGAATWAFAKAPSVCLQLLCRAAQGLAASGISVSSLCVILEIVPADSLATAMAYRSLSFGIGNSAAPLLGSALYHFGGFELPFYVLGAVAIATGFVPLSASANEMCCIWAGHSCTTGTSTTSATSTSNKSSGTTCSGPIAPTNTNSSGGPTTDSTTAPQTTVNTSSESDSSHASAGMQLLGGGCPLWLLSVFNSMFTMSLPLPFIAHHLNLMLVAPDWLSSSIYGVQSAAFMISALTINPLTKYVPPAQLMCIGSYMMAAALLLLGPTPSWGGLLQGPVGSWVGQLSGFVLMGVGCSFTLIPALPKMRESLDMETPGVKEALSSVFNAAIFFGEAVGPMVGGGLMGLGAGGGRGVHDPQRSLDGFAWATTYAAVAPLSVGLLIQWHLHRERQQVGKGSDEEAPPLRSIPIG